MQFPEASAEMTRWLMAHVPSRRKQSLVALLGQNTTGYLLQSCKQLGILTPSPLMAESSP